MKIKLNGIDFETRCITLEELLNIEGHKQKAVVTAVNSEFVAIENRAETLLTCLLYTSPSPRDRG